MTASGEPERGPRRRRHASDSPKMSDSARATAFARNRPGQERAILVVMTDATSRETTDDEPVITMRSGPTMFEVVDANTQELADLRAEVTELRRATGLVLEALTAAMSANHEQTTAQLDDVNARLRMIVG
jgi:hypothetical protein